MSLLARVFKERSCYGKSSMPLLVPILIYAINDVWFYMILTPILSLKTPTFIMYGEKKGQIVSAQQIPNNVGQAKYRSMLNPRMSPHACSTSALLLCICLGSHPNVWLRGPWAKVERALKEASYHADHCQSCRMMRDGFGWRLFCTKDIIKSFHATFWYFIL